MDVLNCMKEFISDHSKSFSYRILSSPKDRFGSKSNKNGVKSSKSNSKSKKSHSKSNKSHSKSNKSKLNKSYSESIKSERKPNDGYVEYVNNDNIVENKSIESEFKISEYNISDEDTKKMLEKKDEIGSGEFGNVYKTEYRGKVVVIKMLKEGASNEFFYNELKIYLILNKFNHGAITKLIGFNIGFKVMVFEYVKGCSLYDYILKHRETINQHPEILFDIIYKMGLAIKFIHSLNPAIIHGDLSLENIMVVGYSRNSSNINKFQNIQIKLIDFGLGYFKNCIDHITSVKGQKLYLSPEILSNGRSSLSEKSDIYSFSVLISQMLCLLNPNISKGNPTNSFIEQIKNYYSKNKSQNIIQSFLVSLINRCSRDQAKQRPSFNIIIPQIIFYKLCIKIITLLNI